MPKKLKEGDLIQVKTTKDIFTGILMPSTSKNILVIKLKSGYNKGINKKQIKLTKLIKATKAKKRIPSKIPANKELKTISILHTGGTLASRVSYETGAVSAKFTPEELVEMFPELSNISNIKSRLIQNMWSDDLRFAHFTKLAKEIKKEAEKSDGIIIGMGTDNLAVTSAALSFICENLTIPVILVGAQRSSDRGSSDALVNLVCAAQFIVSTDFADVAICMHNSIDDEKCVILSACKTRKLHTSRRDAFKPVNDSVIATVDYKTRKIDFFNTNYRSKNKKPIEIKPNMEEKVGLLKTTINMNPKQFDVYKGYKGLVIEGTGLGHIPLDVVDKETKIHEKIKASIKKLIKSGAIVVMTSNCLFGRVNMDVYSKGRELQELGIIPGEDMLPETALVKLSWLLANYSKNEIKNLIKKNLRGEINKRLLVQDLPDFYK